MASTFPQQVHGSAIGLGEETTWGTAVSLTRYLRPLTMSLKKSIRNEGVEDLSGQYATPGGVYQQHFQSSEEVGGSFSFYGSYGNHALSMLLKHALGTVATGAGPPYTHTITHGDSANSYQQPPGLTITQGWLGNSEVFEGCKITRLQLDQEIGRPMVVTCEIIGQTSGGDAGSGITPTHETAPSLILHGQPGSLSFNGASYGIKRYSLTIDNKLVRRPQLGLQTTLEPMRSGFTDFTLAITLEKVTSALKAAHFARTQSDAVLTWTGPSSTALAITLHNGMIWDYDDAKTRFGAIEETLTFKGFADTSDAGLAIALTNANSASV